MALTTAALAVFSFLAPATGTTTSQETATLTPYTAEAVVFNQDQVDDLTDEQLLNPIYADEGEAK
jgi:antirestriction protein ArdC